MRDNLSPTTATSEAPSARPSSTGTKPGVTVIELLAILGIVQLLLVVSNRIGGGTMFGASVGWAGLMAGVVLVWWSLHLRGLTWADIGFRRPRRLVLTIALGVVLAAVTLIVVATLLQLVVVPLLKSPPDSSRFAVLRGNPAALALGLFSVWTSAAFGEEILARGYLLNRLAGLLGGTRGAWISSVILGAVVFGGMHFYQGPSGIVATGLVGLIFGFVYLLNGRNLWLLVLAHGLIDTLSFVQIYLS